MLLNDQQDDVPLAGSSRDRGTPSWQSTFSPRALVMTVAPVAPALRFALHGAGTKYFLVADQIIIVEPNTLRIVMIIDA
jgi:hypothetical protein